MTAQSTRALALWTLDRIKGGKLRRHYDEIATLNEDPRSAAASARRDENLRALLAHATDTTPFYEDYEGAARIEDFPVIAKTTVQDGFDRFRSRAYLEREAFKVATSGSTGVPFFLYQDADKRRRNTADTLYFFNRANYRIGERTYDLEVWRSINRKSPLRSWMRNLVYVDVARFNDPEIEAFLQTLAKDARPKNLVGFVSAFENICKYLDRRGSGSLSHTNVKSIIAISEYLTGYVKSSLERYFGVPVVSRYSNEELGILAQQRAERGSGEFDVNWASYHVEILAMDADVPADEGEPGRIVVTDLFNRCMPLIRYDTGDIAAFASAPSATNPCPALSHVEGRKMDLIYDTAGEIVSSFLVYTKFHDYYALLKQYQFIQTGQKEYLIKLNTHSGDFEFGEQLVRSVKRDFGEDAAVTLELVSEIPPLSSGKRKKVVRLFEPAADAAR